MNKIYPSVEAVLEGIVYNNITLAVRGFGLCGIPEAATPNARYASGR
jgi:3-oxoacid CoA-transferase subunit A